MCITQHGACQTFLLFKLYVKTKKKYFGTDPHRKCIWSTVRYRTLKRVTYSQLHLPATKWRHKSKRPILSMMAYFRFRVLGNT